MPSHPTETDSKLIPTCSHWGNYLIEVRGGAIAAVHPYAIDDNPTPIGQSLLNTMDPGCRVAQPMVRQGYLERGPDSDGAGRGVEPFVAVDWDTAFDVAAAALQQVQEDYGNEAIYAGSYGWASAGRFHHAQSQLHRFMKQFGGYVDSTESYSFAAAEVIMPHIVGQNFWMMMLEAPPWDDICVQQSLVVSFGGIGMKNTQINAGGIGSHSAKQKMLAAKNAGVDFVNISPIRDDMGDFMGAEWLAPRPNTDVAIMLGIAHTLVTEALHDKSFLDKYCVGFDRFLPYLLGQSDGQPKDADWAAGISELAADKIRELARRMAARRTVISISWSLQRAEHGEQPYWMVTVLGAMLGYIGLPGGGVGYGIGATHNIGFVGRRKRPFAITSMRQGDNPVTTTIPVSRISDMLLNPGSQYPYNGQNCTFPDIKLIYWAGGNPYHHHQDLNRLRRAWQRPKTIIINESVWTAAARRADIVFPASTPLERNDLAGGFDDDYISPMRKAVEPFGQSRSDYAIFAGLAGRLEFADTFTEGRNETQWLHVFYEQMREVAAEAEVDLPDFDTFWAGEQISVGEKFPERRFPFENFRDDPQTNALPTPSGKIEIYSETIAGFGYDDCQGHPRWYDKQEALGTVNAETYPLHLLSNQPKTRLHSQYDHGVTSRNAKIQGREPARMNPADAAARGIEDGDVIRLFNDRGACLAGVRLSDDLRGGVIQLATGAWYDPLDPADADTLEVHGNPNVLTQDQGTSKLAQAPTAHSCLVEVERYEQTPPKVKVFSQPLIEPTLSK